MRLVERWVMALVIGAVQPMLGLLAGWWATFAFLPEAGVAIASCTASPPGSSSPRGILAVGCARSGCSDLILVCGLPPLLGRALPILHGRPGVQSDAGAAGRGAARRAVGTTSRFR